MNNPRSKRRRPSIRIHETKASPQCDGLWVPSRTRPRRLGLPPAAPRAYVVAGRAERGRRDERVPPVVVLSSSGIVAPVPAVARDLGRQKFRVNMLRRASKHLRAAMGLGLPEADRAPPITLLPRGHSNQGSPLSSVPRREPAHLHFATIVKPARCLPLFSFSTSSQGHGSLLPPLVKHHPACRSPHLLTCEWRHPLGQAAQLQSR